MGKSAWNIKMEQGGAPDVLLYFKKLAGQPLVDIETGKMIPGELPYGEYELIEVQTCYGYVLDSTPVSFTVDGSRDVVVVEKHNMAQKGTISVSKTGEVWSRMRPLASETTGVRPDLWRSGNRYGFWAQSDPQ